MNGELRWQTCPLAWCAFGGPRSAALAHRAALAYARSVHIGRTPLGRGANLLVAAGLAFWAAALALAAAQRAAQAAAAAAVGAALLGLGLALRRAARFEACASAGVDAMQAGNLATAESLFESAGRSLFGDASRRNLARYRGLLRYRQGRYPEAIACLDEAAREGGGQRAAWIRASALPVRAYLRAVLGQERLARQDLRAAEREPCGLPELARLALAEILLHRGDRRRVLALLADAEPLFYLFLPRRERLLCDAIFSRAHERGPEPDRRDCAEAAEDEGTFSAFVRLVGLDLLPYAERIALSAPPEPVEPQTTGAAKAARESRFRSVAARKTPTPALGRDESCGALHAAALAPGPEQEDALRRVIDQAQPADAAMAARYLAELLLARGSTAEALDRVEEAMARIGDGPLRHDLSALRYVILSAEGRVEDAAAEHAALLDAAPYYCERSAAETRARILGAAARRDLDALAALSARLPLDIRLPLQDELLVDVARVLRDPTADHRRRTSVALAMASDGCARDWVLRFFPDAAGLARTP